MLVLHGSDLQIGKPHLPKVADAFLEHARALQPDLVVVSGDLTQRAKVAEFRAARTFLQALEPLPVVVTPGNHDVPLYRFWERAVRPFGNWHRFIGQELDTALVLEDAVVVSLNSAAPRRAIVGGRLDRGQLDFARRTFADAPRDRIRIVVTHHHFVPTPDGLGGRPLPRAAAILEAFEEMGVELVLGGHVHRTHLTSSRDRVPGTGAGIPLVACGTTASVRGRGPERGLNSLNVIRIHADTVLVEPHRYDALAGRFAAVGTQRLPRPWLGSGAVEHHP